MNIYIYLAIVITICVAATGCSTSCSKYERWNPSHAIQDANEDIKNNKMRIYLHGGIAAYPICIESNEYELVSDLPRKDAGVGCIVYDEQLRTLQREYAEKYNKRIVQYLKKNNR